MCPSAWSCAPRDVSAAPLAYIQQDALLRQAAFNLLSAATKAQQAAIPVPAIEQRKWLAIAARALVQVCTIVMQLMY